MNKKACNSQEAEVRKGPWSMEEDLILINHIANHGEGVWNSLAKAAGLKRTGKSCRLRWLNYLRPGVRRGNITTDEELLIIELHAKWGNRWSKIAKHLPGRTDNEIKNYWRTKIQKQMRQGEGSSPSEHLMELQEQGSTSHMSYPLCDHTMPMGAQLPTTSYQGPAHMYSEPFGSHADSWPLDSTDTYWSMDDLWSMQLLD